MPRNQQEKFSYGVMAIAALIVGFVMIYKPGLFQWLARLFSGRL
jgi:hypothetical protein